MASVLRFPLVPKGRSVPAARRALAPIFGRDETVDHVDREIEEGSRIVTLIGPPGIGKTRAALACLERLAPRFPTGAWFCDLSNVTTEEGLVFAVLSLVGGNGERPADEHALAHVGVALASCGPLLLVLDNFEQLTFAARAVERWCEEAHELVVLITSRERLALAGETAIELRPLDVEAAVQLFAKHAHDVKASDLRVVESIVRLLECIPLAIELAAARTRIMPLSDLEQRLGVGSAVLARSARRDERHATLESAIAWSWDLLSKEEQRALARCSVFAGSFTLESAERVAGGLGEIAALRDKSLLHAEPDGRLGLYVSIRDFAGHKLAELDDANDARIAHARVFAEMAARYNRWRQMLEGAPDIRVHGDIRREKENLVAAIRALRAKPFSQHAELHAELTIAAATLYALKAEESIVELTHALNALPHENVLLRGLVLVARHGVRSNLGEYDAALEDLATLRSLDRLPHDLGLVGRVDEAIALRHHARPREAWSKHLEVAALLEQTNAPRIRGMNEACMGRLAFDLGDFEASRLYNGRAVTIGDELEDKWLGALAIANLAQLEQELGRFDRAEELLATALERLRNVAEIYEAVYASACGDLFFEMGDISRARKWYAQGEQFFRGTLMTHRHAALSWASAAALEAHDGNMQHAASLLEDARRVARRANNPVVFVCVELHGASVEVLGADREARPRLRAEWLQRIGTYGDPTTADGDIVATSFDARFALRIATRMLENAHAKAAPKKAFLRVARSGRWFEVDGERIDLARRGALRRILIALVENHAAPADHGIKQADLLAAGWPGERILAEAASTRVRVAISSLRDLGLRALLLTRDDGYVLDPAAEVAVSE